MGEVLAFLSLFTVYVLLQGWMKSNYNTQWRVQSINGGFTPSSGLSRFWIWKSHAHIFPL